jgi:carbonic anhydrase
MKKTFSTLLSTVVALTLFSGVSLASEAKVHWGYTGHGSPESWGELSPKYHTCSQGKNQSPIDVRSSLDTSLEALKLTYSKPSKEVVNNGHTVQVNMEAGDSMVVDGITFELKQFHFHTPSENHINGKSFPLEAHYVHLDKDGNIAVLALMFEEGKENSELAKIWKKMPKKAAAKSELKLENIASALLPENKDYYRFNGSLTTPPCTEGVRWLVLKTPVSISKEQVEHFLHTMHHPNNRPIQKTNARVIVK